MSKAKIRLHLTLTLLNPIALPKFRGDPQWRNPWYLISQGVPWGSAFRLAEKNRAWDKKNPI